jgi:mono/diheme cytochrome c family protein
MRTWNDGRRLRRLASLALGCALAAVLVALAAGCGASEDGTAAPPPAEHARQQVVKIDPVEEDRWVYARARFREMCAGCHTLADAGAHGPRFNLDHSNDIIEARARAAIGSGEPGMPAWKDVLSKREFEELVAYVSAVDLHTPGEDDWGWQIRLRSAGEGWEVLDPK